MNRTVLSSQKNPTKTPQNKSKPKTTTNPNQQQQQENPNQNQLMFKCPILVKSLKTKKL